MTDLTAADKKEIQGWLEQLYSGYIEYYQDRIEHFSKLGEDLTTGRVASMLGEHAEEVAKSESLLDQFNKITTSKLTNAERQAVQAHLEIRRQDLIQEFRDLVSYPAEMARAAASVVEINTLLQSFNKVTQAQAQATAKKPASPNQGHTQPRLRGH